MGFHDNYESHNYLHIYNIYIHIYIYIIYILRTLTGKQVGDGLMIL